MEECQTENTDPELNGEDRLDKRPHEERTLEDRLDAKEPRHSDVVTEEIELLERMYSLPRREPKRASGKREQPADTYDGAVAVFYNNEKGEIILEFKPYSHPVPEFRGKYAPIGGATQVGESPPETLVREITEEAQDTYKIFLKALIENGRKVDEIKGYVDGVPSVTSVYAAEIKDLEEWEIAKSTRLKEGGNTLLNFGQALSMGNDAFAYQSGEVIKNVIRSNLEERLYTKYPKASFSSQMLSYKPQLYASDIFHNRSPSSIPVRASYNSLNFN